MKQTILLVGCGNIGSRHLQGLMKLGNNVEIFVVEPQEKAIRIAKTRINEVNFSKKPPKVFWYKEISEVNKKNDLVIIATNSKNRVKLISQLLKHGNKKFLIEKIVCQSKKEYCKLLLDMKKNKAKGWVNISRRYFDSYQRLQKILNVKSLILNVDAGNLGLGTNTIHFLDLFLWFSKSFNITLNGSFLDSKILPNKRGKNYVEFSGTIMGKTKHGGLFTITSHSNKNLPLTILFVTNNYKILVNETDSKLTVIKGTKKLNFKNKNLSDISNHIAYDILTDNSSMLPTLEDCYMLHLELFKIFNQHLKKFKKRSYKLCPIT